MVTRKDRSKLVLWDSVCMDTGASGLLIMQKWRWLSRWMLRNSPVSPHKRHHRTCRLGCILH